MTEEPPLVKGQSRQQNRGKPCHPTTDGTPLALDQNTDLFDSPHPLSPSDDKERPEAVRNAIIAGFDHQALQNVQSSPPALGANDPHHTPSSTGEKRIEQQPEVGQSTGTTSDLAPQLDVEPEGQRVMRTHFAWKKGFLSVHKPPIRRPTPMSTQHRHYQSAQKGLNNPPRAPLVVGSPLATTGKQSGPSSFLQRYDVRLHLRGLDGTTHSEWEGVTNLFLRMQAIDATIELLPWAVKDHHHHLPIAITSIPQVFFDFHTYVPGLACKQVSLRSRLELGDMRHPSLLLRSSVPPQQLADKLQPWMEATRQRMWVRQLQLVERTRCIGWLLYSAPEYNLDNLHRQIKKDTGINVECRFRSIADTGASWTDRTIPRIKAIHLEVDHSIPPSQLQHLEKAYSAGAKRFPLGIKMRLVSTGTGTDTDSNVGKMITLQARFLKYTETRWIHVDDHDLKPQQRPLYETLQAMTLPPSQANKIRKPLFHAVSPSPTNDGYQVRYLPQYRAPAQAAIARLYNQPKTIPVGSISPPITSQNPSLPSPSEAPKVPSYIEVVAQWIWSRFNTPCRFSGPPTSNPSIHLIAFSPTTSPCHHKLFPWLTALKQKYQDTAWDKWRYRNGVP